MKNGSTLKLSEAGILCWIGNVLITIVAVHLLRSGSFTLSGNILDLASDVLFDLFIKLEWIVAFLVFHNFFIHRVASKRVQRIYGLVILIVVAQAIWLLPSINSNFAIGIDSVLFFVTLESAKSLLLGLMGIMLISDKKK